MEDHKGFWSLKQGGGEIQRARGGEWGGGKREAGWKEERKNYV